MAHQGLLALPSSSPRDSPQGKWCDQLQRMPCLAQAGWDAGDTLLSQPLPPPGWPLPLLQRGK